MNKNPDSILENTDEQTPETEETAVAETEPAAESAEAPKAERGKSRPVTRRYNRNGKRRGKYAYAAPLGVLVSFLAVVGVAALILVGVFSIRAATDISYMEEELFYFLEPAMFYTPEPFEDAATQEQDPFLNAAAFRVMQAEQIRMLREGDETCQYPVDDNGRIAVPVEEIEASYKVMFGPEAVLTHRSTEGNVEYSEADACYYVPFEIPATGYIPFIVSMKRTLSTYEIRLGFVQNADIQLDEYGNDVPPTEEQAAFFQTYTLQRDKEKDTYFIKSCVNE